MHFKTLDWNIGKLASNYAEIDPKPQYQRGEVWDIGRKQLLIDTILCGFDIPKIYFRHLNGHDFKYEVADGQQRIRAIHEYINDGYKVGKLNGAYSTCSGLLFSELPPKVQALVTNYELTITVAYNASNDEIREVFRRLQLGVQLNPAEKRNSIPSAIGDSIRAMAQTHVFFKNSCFPSSRFKHDDLLSHAYLLALSGPHSDLKAPDILAMYTEYQGGTPNGVESKVNGALKFLNQMQQYKPRLISRKWGFVDLINWKLHSVSNITPVRAADIYCTIEEKRLKYNKKPEDLLQLGEKSLFDYTVAFKLEAGTRKNIKVRYNYFKTELQ